MKKILIKLFSVKSDDFFYRREVIIFIVAIIISMGLMLSIYFFPDSIMKRLLVVTILFLFVYMCIAFVCRLINISDNRERNAFLDGKIKFNYKPIYIELEKFMDWLVTYDEPESVYFECVNGTTHIIEIVFDVKGLRGKYYNKRYFFDKDKLDISQIILFLRDFSFPSGVKVLASFDGNSPTIISKEIEELKRK